MSGDNSDSESATESTALMDGHVGESRPDREIAERNARKRRLRSDAPTSSYGVKPPIFSLPNPEIAKLFCVTYNCSKISAQYECVTLHL